MKFTPSTSIALLVLLTVGTASAFSPTLHSQSKVSALTLSAAGDLVPEPEGGEEITAVKTMPGSRMKNMGEAESLTGVRDTGDNADNTEEGTVYSYWLQSKVEGSLVKEIHATVLRESAKNANFPGFRKGQVPPFAMPQIRGFAVQESIVQTCQSAVAAYGLKSVSGSDGEVDVKEDIPAVAKTYKLGDDLEFTATFNALVDPELQPAPEEPAAAEESSSDGVVDVESEAVADE